MLEHVGAVGVELARGRVHGDGDIAVGLVARGVDAGEQGLERGLVGVEVGGEAALVAHGGAQPALAQRPLERVEDLGPHAQALGERARAAGHDHELLEVDLVVGVGPAVEHVHHRHGKHVRRLAAEVAPQRLPGLRGRGVRRRQRHGEDRVGAQARLVRGAVQRDQRLVERRAGRTRRGP